MRSLLGEDGLLSDDKRSVATFEEYGKMYRGENDEGKRLLRYKVDGEWKLDGPRCDFALCLPETKVIYLIELKGKDLRTAATQIYETLHKLKEKIDACKVHARVVLSRVQQPDIRSTQVVKLERELIKYKGSFKRQCSQMREKV
jgi:hypothetical protein